MTRTTFKRWLFLPHDSRVWHSYPISQLSGFWLSSTQTVQALVHQTIGIKTEPEVV